MFVAKFFAGYEIFALQNGGWCATSVTARYTYKKYGEANNCGADGEGGRLANHVYEITGTGWLHQSYSTQGFK